MGVHDLMPSGRNSRSPSNAEENFSKLFLRSRTSTGADLYNFRNRVLRRNSSVVTDNANGKPSQEEKPRLESVNDGIVLDEKPAKLDQDLTPSEYEALRFGLSPLRSFEEDNATEVALDEFETDSEDEKSDGSFDEQSLPDVPEIASLITAVTGSESRKETVEDKATKDSDKPKESK